MQSAATDGRGIAIIYDGQCPFCSSYVRLLRLRETVGPVRLIDARSADPQVVAARAEGLDLDRGMIVRLGDATYHGDRALHVLALLSTGGGAFNGLMRRVFGSARAARLAYPLLAAGRRATLRALGRVRIGPGDAA